MACSVRVLQPVGEVTLDILLRAQKGGLELRRHLDRGESLDLLVAHVSGRQSSPGPPDREAPLLSSPPGYLHSVGTGS